MAAAAGGAAGPSLSQRGDSRILSRRTAILCLTALALLIALSGVRRAIRDPSPIDVLISLALGIGMTVACHDDARRMGKRITEAGCLATFFLWPIAVPIYLIWSRGWKRGVPLALGGATALLALHLVPFFVMGYTIRGDAFFTNGR